MAAKKDQQALIEFWAERCKQLLHLRNNLPRKELEYVAQKMSSMKDERLKENVSILIGWDDEERAELETFCAIAIEMMKEISPSKLRECARRVELRYLNKEQ